MAVARGMFEVTLTPGVSPDPAIGSFTLAKTFSGDLEGHSRGQMLGAGDPKLGAAGYVAMERVDGSLGGHHGSFTLQHSGVMVDATTTSTVSVVPGSGTGTLSGLRGTMVISQSDGVHHYVFDYSLTSP